MKSDSAVSTAHQYLMITHIQTGHTVLPLLHGLYGILRPGPGVPDLDRGVHRAADDHTRVLVEGHAVDSGLVTSPLPGPVARAHVPQHDGLVHAAGDDLGVVTESLHVQNLVSMT